MAPTSNFVTSYAESVDSLDVVLALRSFGGMIWLEAGELRVRASRRLPEHVKAAIAAKGQQLRLLLQPGEIVRWLQRGAGYQWTAEQEHKVDRPYWDRQARFEKLLRVYEIVESWTVQRKAA